MLDVHFNKGVFESNKNIRFRQSTPNLIFLGIAVISSSQ